jgi:hypothetical protein
MLKRWVKLNGEKKDNKFDGAKEVLKWHKNSIQYESKSQKVERSQLNISWDNYFNGSIENLINRNL